MNEDSSATILEAPTQANEATQAQGAVSASQPSWNGELPNNWVGNLKHEDLRDSKDLMNFKSVDDLAKSYVSLHKTLGQRPTKFLDANAPKEEWEKFYEANGRPKTYQEYKVERGIPEQMVDKAMTDKYLQYAHAKGRSASDVQDDIKFFDTMIATQMQAQEQAKQQTFQQSVNSLKQEWVQRFNEKISNAQGVKTYLESRGIKLTDDAKNNIELIKAFAEIAPAIGNDKLVTHAGGTDSVGGLQTEKLQIMKNPAYFNSAHPDHESLKARMLMI